MTDNQYLHLSAIRDARAALEQNILALCEQFRAEFGLAVTGCEIHTASTHNVQDKYPRKAPICVTVELESI